MRCDYNHPHRPTNARNLYKIMNHPHIQTLLHVPALGNIKTEEYKINTTNLHTQG